MKKRTPIFPLNLVVFPLSLYPLHIFEERYKRMIKRCIRSGEHFGIVSKIDLEISEIGCLVYVSKILKDYETGRKDILVQGVSRFKTIKTYMHKDGYLEAEIKPFKDIGEFSVDEEELSSTLTKFENIISRTSIQLNERFWQNLTELKSKSFKLAEKSGLTLKQQQDLLSIQNENERLKYLSEHFDTLEKSFDNAELLRDIIAGDGYVEQ